MGALIGDWLLPRLNIHLGVGIVALIINAFVGAIGLLLIVRLIGGGGWGYGPTVIRDNKPMDDSGLSRCLQDDLTPRDWYELLNERVFFWLTRNRLIRLLNAESYAESAHDVLELDTRQLVLAHRASISLCPMNSGCTKPVPHPPGKATFLSIAAYPYEHWRKKRPRGERAVELAVSPGVPSIERFVRRVVRMQGEAELGTVFERR